MFRRATAAILAVVLSISAHLPVFAAPRFSDIVGHWCEKEVAQASDLGFINGYPDGTMRPDKEVTRAEFLKMVVAANKLPLADARGHDIPFVDVLGHWFLPYLGTAVGWRIVEPSEYPGRQYEPDRQITRDEAAAYVIRALGLSDVARTKDPNSAPFRDMGTVSGFYLGEVALCAEMGILKGYEDGTVRGNRTLTRAEAVVMVLRALSWKNSRPRASIPLDKYLKVWYAVSGSIDTYTAGGSTLTTPLNQDMGLYYSRTCFRLKSGSLEYKCDNWIECAKPEFPNLLDMLYGFDADRAGVVPLLAAPPLYGEVSEDLWKKPFTPVIFGTREGGVRVEGNISGEVKGPYWQAEGDRYYLCREVTGTWEYNSSTAEKARGDFSVVVYYDPVTGSAAKADLLYHGTFEHTKTAVSAQVHVVRMRFTESEQFEPKPF